MNATETEIKTHDECHWCCSDVDHSGKQGEQLAAKLKRMGDL